MGSSDVRFGVLTGSGVLAFLTLVGVLYPAPLSILALGLVLGSLSGLLAMGLVLVYRANRIVNFAQGDLGGLAGVLAASLIVGPEWPFFAAIAAGFAAAVVLGAATEILVIRRFASAPRLVLTVATIGLAQLFGFGQLALPRLFDYDTAPQPPVPFDVEIEWFPVVFRGGHVLILLTVPAVAVALALFFRRSRIGIAIRAAAESAARAALLGVPVRRINTLVWVLAAAMSGIGVLLRLPIQGVAIGAVVGPTLLLRALAAAVVGGMESLPRTLAAAVVLGMVEQAVLYETGRTIVVDAVLFGVILVALLTQRGRREERARDAGVSSWSATREVRPIPRELRRFPEVRGAVWGAAAIGLLALLLLPLQWSASAVNLFGIGVVFAIVMCSLVVLTGWGGQISLGHLAMVAVGGAVAGVLAQQGKDFFVCLAAAALAGGAVSTLIGVPALRVRGPFFAVTSLALALATGTFFLNREFFPWLVPDPAVRITRPILFAKFDLESEHTYYYVLLAFFVLAAAVVWRLQTSRTGRALVATRDNARAAQSFAISPSVTQLTGFAVSGLLAGLAGGLYVFSQHSLSGTLLEPQASIKLFSIAVVGGLGSLPGAVIGAAYLTFVDFSPFTRETLSRLFASGIGVLAVLLFLPAGLGGLLYDWRDALLRAVARRRGVVVPSLVADVATTEAAPPAPATSARDPILEVRDLKVAYGKAQVLFGVDLHVERDEILALLGTNGAGKSTLLAAVAGLVRPQGGEVLIDGVDVTGRDAAATAAAGIVLAPGGKGVFPTLTVAENLALAGWLRAEDPDGLAAATADVLDFFPVLRQRWDQRAGNLSGGEQQMLTLGMAFIARPRLLMIDELSLGLAPVVVEQLLTVVRAIHAQGTAVVLVEQSVNVAVTLASRAVFLEKGAVRFDGPTAALLRRPDVLRAVFLDAGTAAAQAPSTFRRECEVCGVTRPSMLELRSIAASFGGVRALDDVTLDVHAGEVVGLIGPNGAGKTTLLDVVSGFVVPTTGTVVLGGQDVTAASPAARAALGLGRSFQDARLFPAMTVRQTIATAFERHLQVGDVMSALVLSPAVGLSEHALDDDVQELIELLRLEAYADKFVGELSTGTRRIVDLACTLAHRPSVLLLDEPSSGIAQRESEALGPLLLDIRDRTGAAVLVIEHDIPLVTAISDRLVAMERGAVVATGPPADVISDPRVVAGYRRADGVASQRSAARRAPRRRPATTVA